MTGKSTMEPLFCARSLVEKYRKNNKLCMVFIDLGKECHMTECQEKWALMRKEVPKMCINLIQDVHEGSSISVKSMC